MELVLTRIAKRKAYTIGRLSIIERIDDQYLAGEKETYFCDTLEPPVKVGIVETHCHPRRPLCGSHHVEP